MTAVRKLLVALGLVLLVAACNGDDGNDAAENEEAAEGRPVEQVDPEAVEGALAQDGMPDFIGLTPAEVDEVVADVDVEVESNLHPGDDDVVVHEQDPEPGAEAEPGTTVTLIYRFPDDEGGED